MNRKGKKIIRECSFTVIYEPTEEVGYVVTVPALPSIVTEGRTLVEARKMAKEAIRCHLESLIKDGLPIPEEKDTGLEPVKEVAKVELEYV